MMNMKNNIESWWAENPMTYGSKHGRTLYTSAEGDFHAEFGTKEFFQAADQQFYEWNLPLHTSDGWFGKIFDYEKYRNQSVLEIGCGMGCMASLWANNGANISAVDLNPISVQQTKARFSLFSLPGIISQQDGNNLSFQDSVFDYVYSWGVLHHSPSLENSISELFRVLKPGSGFGVMLYNRRSLLYWYHVLYLEGFLHAESRHLNALQLASRYGDGHREEGNYYTWPVTRTEMMRLFSSYAGNVKIKCLGTDLDSVFQYLIPGFGKLIPSFIIKPWARRFGWSLWIYGNKD